VITLLADVQRSVLVERAAGAQDATSSYRWTSGEGAAPSARHQV